jgi:hypothetical protein
MSKKIVHNTTTNNKKVSVTTYEFVSYYSPIFGQHFGIKSRKINVPDYAGSRYPTQDMIYQEMLIHEKRTQREQHRDTDMLSISYNHKSVSNQQNDQQKSEELQQSPIMAKIKKRKTYEYITQIRVRRKTKIYNEDNKRVSTVREDRKIIQVLLDEYYLNLAI